ncbi:MAG TPA: hypothetical protein VM733_13560 [Thermoanaerobaculia bacterium]|nr:hypothetical protein [Thermoanaerobaculia bacterium]
MIIAVEDPLSEAIARKLFAELRPDLPITSFLGNHGNTYLRSKARDLNRAAATVPVFLLTDLDSPSACPPGVIAEWLGRQPAPLFLFRVAVMEVESWVLADRAQIAPFLGVPEHRIPLDTDTIPNPKQFLVNLARRSRSTGIRTDLVPVAGSTASVGPMYNPRLGTFVSTQWSAVRARASSPSLARTVERLRRA